MASQEDAVQPRDRRPWTEEEDEALRMAIEEEDPDCNPPTRWHAISQHMPHRTNKDCRKRWWAQMATAVSKGSWTSDEDERLCGAVEELGPKWALVANRVRTRNSGQCAKRWNDALNPSIDRSGWSRDEDEQLLKAVEEHGHAWASIARTSLPGRTGLAAKNRYNHLIRSACHRVGRRNRRKYAISGAPSRKKTRGVSVSSSSISNSEWGTGSSCSDSLVFGTIASSAASSPVNGDDDYLNAASETTTCAFFTEDEMLSNLSTCLLSPVLSAPHATHHAAHHYGDPTSPSETPHDIASLSCDVYLPFDEMLPDFLGNGGQMDLLPLWSPTLSASTTPADSPFVDPLLPLSQSTESTFQTFPFSDTPTLHHDSPCADPMSMKADYIAACSAMQSDFSRLVETFPEFSHATFDSQVTVAPDAALPNRTSIQISRPMGDDFDRRVAVAVAICDQQDVISTVHSLSHSLTTMLGQGYVPTLDQHSAH